MFYTTHPTDDQHVFECIEVLKSTPNASRPHFGQEILNNTIGIHSSTGISGDLKTNWLICKLKPCGFETKLTKNVANPIDRLTPPLPKRNPWAFCYRIFLTTNSKITVEEWNLFKVRRWYIIPPRKIRFYIWIAITSPGICFYFYNNKAIISRYLQKKLKHCTPPASEYQQPLNQFALIEKDYRTVEGFGFPTLPTRSRSYKPALLVGTGPKIKKPVITKSVRLKKKKYPQVEPMGGFFKDKLQGVQEESFRYTIYDISKQMVADAKTGYAGKFSHLQSWVTKMESPGPKKRERNRKKVITNNRLAYIWTERMVDLDRVYITTANAKRYPPSTTKILQALEDRRLFLLTLINSLKPVPKPPLYYSLYPKEFFLQNPTITPQETLRMYKKTVNAMYAKTKREWRKELEKHHRRVVKIIKESRTDVVSKPPHLTPITPETKKKHGDYIPGSTNQILTLWIYKFNMHQRFWKLPKSTAIDIEVYDYSIDDRYASLEETGNWINQNRFHKNHIDTLVDCNFLRWLRNAYPSDLESIQKQIDSQDLLLEHED